MILSRRTFLQAGGSAAVGLSGLRRVAFADSASAGDAIVVIFQRGGCDGLSFLAPTNDPDYMADRPQDLRVLGDGPKPGRPLKQTFAPAIDFRLHPEAAPLGELYDQRHLALLHAVGLTNGTRSHFVAQDLIDRGLNDEAGMQSVVDGWLSRLLAAHPSLAPAVSANQGLSPALAFHGDSLAIPDLRGGLGFPGGAQVRQALADLYRNGHDPFSQAAGKTLNDMGMVDSRLPRGPDGKIVEYQSEAATPYEETESGRSLRTVARLLKMEIGLSVACVDIGGWDHHDNLAGRFAGLAGQFSRALSTFWNDVSGYHDRLTVVVMTEFGRRLRTNKSNGADHGHGGVMMVLSGHAAGGEIYGRWPGLASGQLDNGVDLAVTTDYRSVLAEVLAVRLRVGKEMQNVFPGLPVTPYLGVVRA